MPETQLGRRHAVPSVLNKATNWRDLRVLAQSSSSRKVGEVDSSGSAEATSCARLYPASNGGFSGRPGIHILRNMYSYRWVPVFAAAIRHHELSCVRRLDTGRSELDHTRPCYAGD
jgi:hypothetical protein